jgi:hypothetical protein
VADFSLDIYKKDGFVEIYTEGRYFSATGNVYGGVKQIEIRTAELQAVHDRFMLPAPAQRPVSKSQAAAWNNYIEGKSAGFGC